MEKVRYWDVTMLLVNGTNVLLVFGISVLVYRYYATFKQHPWYTPLSVVLGFFFALWVIFLVPIDLVSTRYDSASANPDVTILRPLAYTSPQFLDYMWSVAYWIPYLLCWTAFPVLMSYSTAGGFSIFDRLRYAVLSNLIFYAIVGGVLLVLLIYVLIVYNTEITYGNIKGVAVASSNAYGLVLCILLLGYGLVEMPRQFWRSANLPLMMKHLQYRIVGLVDELHAAKTDLRDTMRIVKFVEENTDELDPFKREVVIS